MKKILFAILVSFSFAGCGYREEPLPDVRGLLSKHTWYVSEKHVNGFQFKEDCDLSEEFVFNKDCTGKLYNPNMCNGHDTTVEFEWYLASDSKSMYLRKPATKALIAILRVTSYFDDQTTLQGNWDQQSYYVKLTNVRVH